MSRVYDALCRSQAEQGLPNTLLDPDALVPEVVPVPSTTLEWGKIPVFHASPQRDRLVALNGHNGLGPDKFRLLRARLRHLQDRTRIKRVVITSAVPEEGKTLVATNLAISLAKNTSQRVLLLDGDLHKPAVAERFGLAGASGISEWWSTNQPIHRFLYKLEDAQLWLLCAGVAHEHPLTILQSPRFLEILRQLSELFDWVLIDAPPLSPLADTNFWARQSDGLLLVVRNGKAPRKLLQKGLEAMDNPRLLGVVFNDVQAPDSTYYSHYYSHSKDSSITPL